MRGPGSILQTLRLKTQQRSSDLHGWQLPGAADLFWKCQWMQSVMWQTAVETFPFGGLLTKMQKKEKRKHKHIKWWRIAVAKVMISPLNRTLCCKSHAPAVLSALFYKTLVSCSAIYGKTSSFAGSCNRRQRQFGGVHTRCLMLPRLLIPWHGKRRLRIAVVTPPGCDVH